MVFFSPKTMLALAALTTSMIATTTNALPNHDETANAHHNHRFLAADLDSLYDTTYKGLPAHKYSGNDNCADFGYDFGWKDEGCFNGGKHFDSMDTDTQMRSGATCSKTRVGSVSIVCSDPDGDQFRDATITPTVNAVVIMKGGNGGVIYSGLQAGQSYKLDVGERKGISHIEFCFKCDGAPAPEPAPSPEPTPAPTIVEPASTSPPTEKPTSAPTEKPEEKKTPPPTASPTKKPTGGGSFGDPHVKTWGGDQFDFHGMCDLVLVNAPNFLKGAGMEIHIRTKIRTWWSYIESAVIRIGDDTFEVQGGLHSARYWINGVPGKVTETGSLESTIAGFKIHYKNLGEKKKNYRLELTDVDFSGVAIGFETFNDFVRVNVRSNARSDNNKGDNFEGALGLMGAYPTGAKVARDGKTIMEKDTDIFGQEWQVRTTEAKLFHSIEKSQHPQKCEMPSSTENKREKRRRLGDSLLNLEDAKLACARVSLEDRDACMFDVLATNDKGMAGSY